MTHTTQTLLHTLATHCTSHDISAWLVGGAVRDIVLGNDPGDFDIAVDADGVTLAKEFAQAIGGSFVALDDERGTGRVVYAPVKEDTTVDHETTQTHPLIIDLVQLRAPTLHDDLFSRDFPINAMAVPLDKVAYAAEDDRWHINQADIVDPCGGLHDLSHQQLRLCLPTSITDDPLRMLRAVRFAANLNLYIHPELDTAIRQSVSLIAHVAQERIRDELSKLLAYPFASPWIRYLDATGLLTRIIPELEPARGCDQPIFHFLPVLDHLLEAVTCLEWLLFGVAHAERPLVYPSLALPEHASPIPVAVQTYPDLQDMLPYRELFHVHFSGAFKSGQSRTALLKLATLLHDVAKPQTKQPKPEGGVSFYGHQQIGASVAKEIVQRLRFSNHDAEYVETIVHHHMRLSHLRSAESVTPRALYRFFRDTAGHGLDVILHDMADHMAARGHQIVPQEWNNHIAWSGALLASYQQQQDKPQRPLLNGHELMTALHIAPGRMIGKLLSEIREAQAVGEVETREDALKLARQLLSEM